MNGQQFSSSGVSFTYRPAAAVSSVWPAYGVAEGGTPVTVLGSGFSSSAESLGSLLCRFDGDARTTVGRFLNGSAVACPTLPTEQGARDSSVSVSNDAGLHWSTPGVPFTYYEPERPPLLRSVSP